MRNRYQRIWVLLLLLTGCAHNHSSNYSYPTDYVVGAVYRLKQPVFAEKEDQTIFGTYSELILRPVGEHGNNVPATVADYEQARGFWNNIAGVLPAGTRVSVSQIQVQNSLQHGKMLWIIGQVQDVPWATKPAELSFISQRIDQRGLFGGVPVIDPDLLEPVNPLTPSPSTITNVPAPTVPFVEPPRDTVNPQ